MSGVGDRGTARIDPQAVRHAPAARGADQPAERAMTPTAPTRRAPTPRPAAASPSLAGGLALVAAACGGDDDAADDRRSPDRPAADDHRATVDATTTAPTTTDGADDHGAADDAAADHDDRRRRSPRMPLTGVPLADGQVAAGPPGAGRQDRQRSTCARPQSGPQPGRHRVRGDRRGPAHPLRRRVPLAGRRTRSARSAPAAPRTSTCSAALNQPLFAWSGGNAGVTRGDRRVRLHRPQRPAPAAGLLPPAARPTAPHNLYTNTDALFGQPPPEAGPPAAAVRLPRAGRGAAGRPASPASRCRIGANPVALGLRRPSRRATCARRTAGPHDAHRRRRSTTDNVVVLIIDVPAELRRRRAARRRVTIGGGEAFVFTGGVHPSGTWLRDAPTDGVALLDADGAPIPLHPGPHLGRAGRRRRLTSPAAADAAGARSASSRACTGRGRCRRPGR